MRMERAVARRLDRLARRAHAFHRFAHHPLCKAYEPELLRLGRRTRVCRGCAASGAGMLVGASLGLSVRVPPSSLLAWSSLVLCAGALTALAVTVLARSALASTGKLFTRALPVAVLCFAGARASVSESALQLSALAAGGLALLLLARAYRRRGADRSPCRTCPQYGAAATCDGFAPIVRRERAFMRVSQRLLGDPPPTRPAALQRRLDTISTARPLRVSGRTLE